MNELTIHSRKLNRTINLWMPADGGYIRMVTTENPGTLGDQITKPGGATIEATPETFERECRKWYRRLVKDLSDRGLA